MLGPLYATYLDGDLPFQSGGRYTLWSRLGSMSLMEVRNYIVGPLTEELVFRSTILAVSILARFSVFGMVFGTPLWFGIAHAHHALETFRKNGSTSQAAIQALAGCLFQLTYTTLFGWFASYLFVRTGSILPPLASHIFCNLMGIYLPSTAIQRYPSERSWIWLAYVGGLAGFIFGMRRL
ncbi:prenyl protein peptidase, partial [Tremellales sp. Uapishka_1]